MFWTQNLQGKSDLYIVNEPQKSINYCFNGLQN